MMQYVGGDKDDYEAIDTSKAMTNSNGLPRFTLFRCCPFWTASFGGWIREGHYEKGQVATRKKRIQYADPDATSC